MIAICTPAKETIRAETAFDIVQLVKHSPDTFFTISQGSLLPNQRTTLVKRSIEGHAGHILFIDSDMRFPPDTISRLLAHKQNVVGANCKHRQADKWTSGKTSENKTGIEEVETVGFGVTLIRSEIFFVVQEPWFATPFDGTEFVTDDVFFCDKIKKAGFKIFIDHDLSKQVKHIGSIEL